MIYHIIQYVKTKIVQIKIKLTGIEAKINFVIIVVLNVLLQMK